MKRLNRAKFLARSLRTLKSKSGIAYTSFLVLLFSLVSLSVYSIANADSEITVSGQLTVNSSPVPNATFYYSGPENVNVSTDANGNYSVSNFENGNYSVNDLTFTDNDNSNTSGVPNEVNLNSPSNNAFLSVKTQ